MNRSRYKVNIKRAERVAYYLTWVVLIAALAAMYVLINVSE